MPGSYAHLTMVASLIGSDLLDAHNLAEDAIQAVGKYKKYCDLGAVSPDYPYLDFLRPQSTQWADWMHYNSTGDRIRAGIRFVSALEGEVRLKSLSWLLGYMAHVITDVAIHPVVLRKVGDYAQNKTEHRRCEMHQDVFIYTSLGIGEIGTVDYLKMNIGTCSDPNDKNWLDPDIRAIWGSMLKVDPVDTRDQSDIPLFNTWHAIFVDRVSGISSLGNHLFCWARHVAEDTGFSYPEDPLDEYIAGLETPTAPMHYRDIFKMTQDHVLRYWKIVSDAALGISTASLSEIHNWNLDTGEDEQHFLTLWGTTA